LVAFAVTIALLASGRQDAAATHSCDPSQPDSDGDGLPATCDPFDLNSDSDADGFEDSLEVFVGTNPLSFCSYPADIDNNGIVDIFDVNALAPPAFFSTADDPEYRARLDLNADEIIDIFDVNVLAPLITFSSCPFPVHWSTAIAPIRAGADHLHKAPFFLFSPGIWVADFFTFDPATFCGEVEEVANRWTNNTDFRFQLSIGPGTGLCTLQPGGSDVRIFWAELGPFIAGGAILFDATRICTDNDPCQFAVFADVMLNNTSPSVTGNADFRKMTLTHEFGHVVGLDDIDTCSDWSIMFGSAACTFSNQILSVRPNDIVFTNVKY
jgi:hypothetical protein